MSKFFVSAALAALFLFSVPASAQTQGARANPHLREGCLHCHHSDMESPTEGTRIITPEEEGPHAVISHSCRTCHKDDKKDFWILILPEGRTPPPGAVRLPPSAAAPPPSSAASVQEEGFANSHDSMECTKCHETHPGSIKGSLVKSFPFGPKGVDGFCRGCHDKTDQTHFPRANRPRATVSCTSCHLAHGSSLLYPSLRDDYPVLLVESKDLNPHGGTIFCLSCHRDSPQGGGIVNFRDDDFSGLCRRCHKEMEHHPLGVKSSKGTWKMDFSDFPLQEGSVTCVTCHDPYECDDVRTSDNPRFLRGGPYNTVEEFCERCHEGRTFASLNPHDQIDEEGNVRKKQCLYCHTSFPDQGFELGPEDFTDDLQTLCVSCHPYNFHPDVDHMVEVPARMETELKAYEERRLVNLPLVGGRFLTCVTCHNPHERGLLKGPSGIGADEEKRLRLATFNEICTPCHGRH